MLRWTLLLVAAVLANDVRCSGVAPLKKLNNGQEIPVLGVGTWLGIPVTGDIPQSEFDKVQQAVEWAIDAGYRHIDTAAIYKTEKQVGAAIRKKIAEGVVKREEIFVTTKLWNNEHAKEDVLPALRNSVAELGLGYIDLFLIHYPVALDDNGTIIDVDYLDTWEGMIEGQRSGLTKSIGVSNFNLQQLQRIINATSVVPQNLQIELNLNLQQPALLEYCRSKDIAVTAYTPFGSLFYSKAQENSPLPRIDTPELVAIAKKYNKTVPQITLRYLLDLGLLPIPKSVTKARLEENIAVFDFDLTEDEKNLLKSYDNGYRTLSVKLWMDSPYYPFEK